MGKFIHIFIEPKNDITRKTIEEKMDLAIDWMRYHDNIYIVYTNSNVNKWQQRLLNFVKPDGKLFICELDTAESSGWMLKDFWEWVQKERTK